MSSPRPKVRLAVAGGGTGGHLFPALAVVRELRRRCPQSAVLFINAGRPLERRVLRREGYASRTIWTAGIKGRRIGQQLAAAARIPVAMVQAAAALRTFRAHLLLAVGGYAAGPAAVAAWLLGIPVVLHEQNLLPGVTNRLVGRIARRVYLSHPAAGRYFRRGKVRITGNPVRPEIARCRQRDDHASEPFTVLVVGGSQGSRSINRAVVESLPHIAKPAKMRFDHQTGAADERQVRDAYRERGIPATVKTFFHDMARRYHRADLVICRAGATTVAEITAVGLAAVFIPFPHAADNHQEVNARGLAAEGAAEMIVENELDGNRLAACIEKFRRSPELRRQMAERARRLGRLDAAAVIIEDCRRLLAPTKAAEGFTACT